jgi:hypothetical protein
MRRLGRQDPFAPASRKHDSTICFDDDCSAVSFGGRYWTRTVLFTDFWFGLITGAALLAIGLFVGWLIWG